MPAACRSGSLNSTLMDRQNWIEAFENTTTNVDLEILQRGLALCGLGYRLKADP